MGSVANYESFLGEWELIPDSCRYEQGAPPQSGRYRIEANADGVVTFTATWTDADGKPGEVSFAGPADGSPVPLPQGELADALVIHAVSDKELNTVATKNGKELMVAQRQLDDTRSAMRITQLVRLPDGTAPTNVSIYRRVLLH